MRFQERQGFFSCTPCDDLFWLITTFFSFKVPEVFQVQIFKGW